MGGFQTKHFDNLKIVAAQDVLRAFGAFEPKENKQFRKAGKKVVKWANLAKSITKILKRMRKKRKPEFHTGIRIANRVYETVMLTEAETAEKLMSKLEKRSKRNSMCETQRAELAAILTGLLTSELINY